MAERKGSRVDTLDRRDFLFRQHVTLPAAGSVDEGQGRLPGETSQARRLLTGCGSAPRQ